MNRLLEFWTALRTSLWFLPALIILGAVVLAVLLIQVDVVLRFELAAAMPLLFGAGAEGARGMLTAIASSMITVAGVIFSITIVALSLASSQFGPRLLRNFMRDRGNQVVLGTFIATFVYCLLVLRTVRGENGGAFVPHISVTVAVGLALASLGVLIFFIHHAAVSMQAPQIIANVSAELHASIDALFPETLGEGPEENGPHQDQVALPDDFERDARPVAAQGNGYIQLINDERLLRLAVDNDLLLRVVHRPGHFVVEGDPLALVWPGRQAEQQAGAIRDTFILGPQQTPIQDVDFAVSQLVEVAVRALSPGVNDPFTAVTCVDQLGAALCGLAKRKIPTPYRRDENGRLRVIAYPLTFAEVADTALRQIRQYGRTSTAVLVRLLEVIAVVLGHTRREEDRAALLRHALLIKESAQGLSQETDRKDVADRYEKVLEKAGEGKEKPEGS